MRKVKKPSESRGRVRFLDENERKNLLEECENSPNIFLKSPRYSNLINKYHL
jgi:hypothetical protein